MYRAAINLARRAKRRILHGGYSVPVAQLLSSPEPTAPDGRFTVNLSFDLEFSMTSAFWRENYDYALDKGLEARKHFPAIARYLTRNDLPFNLQLLMSLADKQFLNWPGLAEEQREIVQRHPHLFTLSDEDEEILSGKHMVLGIHGFSHRSFDQLTEDEAVWELKKSLEIYQEKFNTLPKFMSFPDNYVFHEHRATELGIQMWRGSKHNTVLPEEIPLGLIMTPNTLTPPEFRKILKYLRENRPGYLLHLWGHFTECDLETFKEYLDAVTSTGFGFEAFPNNNRGKMPCQ